ncbi:ATP-binding protein [Rhizomonospora bruguierae]|uniref:ATP-binding protein n=1 Tax=Rhizomonospora bruguierae TaxID=1581705 RepID=UPI001BCB622F|nr:helix-turn-helix domain-containing protein [Micromonospora sp. NBRC 107566]
MSPDHGAEQGSAGFAARLRAHRRAAGLTQADLSGRAGVGVRTVRDLERGRASRPQRTTVELLAAALGLVGAERADFVAASRGRATAEPPPDTGGPPAGAISLPNPGNLVGRALDVADISHLLTGEKVVTLVGLAGVGKTALALAVAHHVAPRYPGGVAGVVISEVSTTADVLAATAAVFGVGRAGDLANRLSDAPALLLLDAAERSAAAVVEALGWLSQHTPALRVVATGRHPLGIAGEQVWPVAPLEVPPAGGETDLATVEEYPAAALFLAQLRQVRREPVGPHEVGPLVSLVRRLGGLPLALELAAARGRVLELGEILDRYGDRLLDLAGAAESEAGAVTLRDAVAASYRLLGPAEQYALRRLCVFRNRWSVELAEALLTEESAEDGGAAAGDPVPLLDRLMALGLVSVRGAGPFRFRLVDVVRDFAVERAAAAGELVAARRRHAVIFARLAARAAPDLVGPQLTATVAHLDDVASDLWAALAHAADDDPPTALCLASKLPRWWRFRGRDVPGRQWLRRLLDDPGTAGVGPKVIAWARLGVAQLALEHGAAAEELPLAERALADFAALGDVTGELAARSVLCALYMSTGGYDEARQHGEAGLTLATRTGRVRDMAVAQNNLTWHEIRVGDLAAARRRLAAVDRLAAQCGEERLRAVARANLADVARLEGRYEEAEVSGRRAVAMLEDLGDPGHRRRALAVVGLALAQSGRDDEAAKILAELRAMLGDPAPDDATCAAIEANLALSRGERELAAEWFAVAAQAYEGMHDLRDVVEALVGAVATTDDPAARANRLAWLDRVRKEGGITLLPREHALLGVDGR